MGYAAKLGSSGGSNLVITLLGTATTYNLSTDIVLSKYYKDLTINNFFYKITNSGGTVDTGWNNNQIIYFTYYQPTLSYDSSTGVLSTTQRARIYGDSYNTSWQRDRAWTLNSTVQLYVFYIS